MPCSKLFGLVRRAAPAGGNVTVSRLMVCKYDGRVLNTSSSISISIHLAAEFPLAGLFCLRAHAGWSLARCPQTNFCLPAIPNYKGQRFSLRCCLAPAWPWAQQWLQVFRELLCIYPVAIIQVGLVRTHLYHFCSFWFPDPCQKRFIQ